VLEQIAGDAQVVNGEEPRSFELRQLAGLEEFATGLALDERGATIRARGRHGAMT
jgi:hypothetical protein